MYQLAIWAKKLIKGRKYNTN